MASSVDNGGCPTAQCADKFINKAVSIMRMSFALMLCSEGPIWTVGEAKRIPTDTALENSTKMGSPAVLKTHPPYPMNRSSKISLQLLKLLKFWSLCLP